jgi:predicted nuclease with TOPRIM domain
MEVLTKEELKRAIVGLEKDRTVLVDRLWNLRKEMKEIEEDLDYSHDNIQDIKKRIRALKTKI